MFVASRLRAVFRIRMVDTPRAVLTEIRHAADGPAMALLWRATGHRFGPGARCLPTPNPDAAYGPLGPIYRAGRDWVGLSETYVWTAGGGRRDDLALGFYVQILERLDENGARLARTPTGWIPDEDEESLGDLAP